MICSSGDCKGKVKYECEDCGQTFCSFCASMMDYECDCTEPPKLILIKKWLKKL